MTKTKRYLLALFYVICSYIIISHINSSLYKKKHLIIKYIKKPTNQEEQGKILEAILFLKQYTQEHNAIEDNLKQDLLIISEHLNNQLALQPAIELVYYDQLLNNIPTSWYTYTNNKYKEYVWSRLYDAEKVELLIYKAIAALHKRDITLYREYIMQLPKFALSKSAKRWMMQAEHYIYYQDLLSMAEYQIRTTEIMK